MTIPAFDPNSTTFMQDTQAACRGKLRELLDSNLLSVFAFATSSLKGVPIQAVILDAEGDVVFDDLIKTFEALDPGSQAFHGIQQAQVNAAQDLAHHMESLQILLGEDEEGQVITFSPDFMREALVRACKLEGLEMFGTSHWLSGQDLLAPLVGTYNWTTSRWSRPKLVDCIKDLPMPAHFAPIGTALGNAQRLHALMVHYAQEPGQQVEAGTCERCGCDIACTCQEDLPEGDES